MNAHLMYDYVEVWINSLMLAMYFLFQQWKILESTLGSGWPRLHNIHNITFGFFGFLVVTNGFLEATWVKLNHKHHVSPVNDHNISFTFNMDILTDSGHYFNWPIQYILVLVRKQEELFGLLKHCVVLDTRKYGSQQCIDHLRNPSQHFCARTEQKCLFYDDYPNF